MKTNKQQIKKYVYVIDMLCNDIVTHSVKIFSNEQKAREFCTSFNNAKFNIDNNSVYFSYNRRTLE